MIKVMAKMFIKAEGKDAFIIQAEKLVAETRKEEGCLSYQLFKDINNNNCFVMLEEWETPEFLDKHLHSCHFQEMMAVEKELREKETELSILTLLI